MNKHSLNKYDLLLEQYETIFIGQNFKCNICSKDVYPQTKEACVDHDHTTGKVRGILRTRCNLLLEKVESGDISERITKCQNHWKVFGESFEEDVIGVKELYFKENILPIYTSQKVIEWFFQYEKEIKAHL